MLVETPITLVAGDSLQVELPEIGAVRATVEWTHDCLLGCSFDAPVPKSVVSAALLRSPADLPALSVGQIIPPQELADAFPAVPGLAQQLPDPAWLNTATIVSLVLSVIAALILMYALLAFAAPSL